MQHSFFSKINFGILSEIWTTLSFSKINFVPKTDNFFLLKTSMLSWFRTTIFFVRQLLSNNLTDSFIQFRDNISWKWHSRTDFFSEKWTSLITIFIGVDVKNFDNQFLVTDLNQNRLELRYDFKPQVCGRTWNHGKAQARLETKFLGADLIQAGLSFALI